MANGSVLVDTTVVIDFLRAEPATVGRLSQGKKLHLSAVVVGELL